MCFFLFVGFVFVFEDTFYVRKYISSALLGVSGWISKIVIVGTSVGQKYEIPVTFNIIGNNKQNICVKQNFFSKKYQRLMKWFIYF